MTTSDTSNRLMHAKPLHKKALTIMMTLLGLAGVVGALWWSLMALKPYDITPAQLQARFVHDAPQARSGPVQTDPAQRVIEEIVVRG